MPVASQWQIWRRNFLPIAESILGFSNKQSSLSSSYYARPKCRNLKSQTAIRTCASYHTSTLPPAFEVPHDVTNKEVRERKQELDRSGIEAYPRYNHEGGRTRSIKEFYNLFEGSSAQSLEDGNQKVVEVTGRIASMRLMGKMAFIDILEDQLKLQTMLSFSTIESTGVTRADFNAHCRLMRRGDHIAVTGRPCRTDTGQLSIKPTALPRILSPCLNRFPAEEHGEAAATHDMDDKHVQMLANSDIVSTIKTRASIIHHMRTFFRQHNFIEVETPILSALAGGATARPFETTATEFPNRKLSLRIAPELWLKKLIVGGMVRIFEIGPSFRNEGLDKTHNPEFTTCEFYSVRDDLTLLKDRTEALLFHLAKTIDIDENTQFGNHQSLTDYFTPPFQEIDFIPALNSALETDLPNLRAENAREQLLDIFHKKGIPIPSKSTLPRLLDKLSSTYLEPQCETPTWIVNIPECLSPLSKSFIHPTAPNNQSVAARAELFIKAKEIVNCYEEENDPFSQRRKFIDQQIYGRDPDSGKIDDEAMKIDEDYIKALEWGLPPTGGWGCGIDRLVMLFTGKERIGDVLSFGNLRAVTRGAESWAPGEQNS